MRTLTLGVLIVSGGTLAALPFRKYQAIPAPSSAPLQVTGPTQSALDAAHKSQLVNTAPVAQEASNHTSLPGLDSTVTDAADASVLASNLPVWQLSAPTPAPRSGDVPLTYEDLALPIDPPPPIAQRFNATIPIRQQQLEQQRVSALVMPEMEELAVTQQIELQRVAENARTLSSQQSDAKAAGKLASSRDSDVEPLPGSAPAAGERHWIRQPE